MYSILYTNQFKKSLKRCVKRGLDVSLLTAAVNILQEKGSLPASYGPHRLKGHNCYQHRRDHWPAYLFVQKTFESKGT